MNGMGFTAYTEREGEEKLRGVIPQHYLAYRIFKVFRIAAILFAILALILFILGFTNNRALVLLTDSDYYGTLIFILLGITGVSCLFMLILYVLFLRKPPFDTWVYEVAQKRLGTEVIYYNSKCLYIGYDVAAAKEVDKRDFVTEMSDKSDHYSYFYVDTFVDQQIIQVECTKRQPIPERASFDKDDDLFWNIIPIGLTINHVTQNVSPVGWWLNDNNKDERLVATVPSTSILIAGGTGCHAIGEEILMADGTIKKVEDIVVGDFIMGPDKKPREVLELHRGQDEMYEIESEDGNKHIVNGGHILPLYDIETKQILNMPLSLYINLDDSSKSKFKLMKVNTGKEGNNSYG